MHAAQVSALPLASKFQTRLLQLLVAERRLLARLGLSAVLGALLALALPYASRVAVDRALPDSAPRLLVVVALGSLILVAHRAWMGWLQATARIALNAAVEGSALRGLVQALLGSDYARLQRRNSGWMLTTLAGAGALVDRYVDGFVTLLTQGAFALAYLWALADASPLVAAIAALVSALIATISYGLAVLEAQHARVLLDRSSGQQQYLHSLMLGLTPLRAMYASERLGAEWSRRVQGCGLAQVRCARAAAFQGIVHAVGTQALSTGILIWTVYRCVDNELTTGGMIFLMVTSSGLSSALLASLAVVMGMRSMRPQLERVNELLSDAQGSPQPAEPPMLTSDHISLKGVSYRYGEDGRWVIDKRDWEVERGAVVRLDSPSGSGKTTLLRMIAGLLPASHGRVSVFGVDAQRARQLVLYVPQHCKLFEASIRDNLELLSGASRSDIQRVSELTGLSRMLAKLPMGEETLVAADGQNLSSGQRQLVVLSAAFASCRPIVLLDEATSQIDAETRAACRWDALFAGRTVIYVEHG